MLSIYTYPTNSGTGYIDPDYYGSTTGGSETGYYKRILDLKAGTYKPWVTGQTAPVDTVSNLITATGKFHKGVRTENGLENIQIYSYYNQPLITVDSVLVNTDISASDTDASPAVRLTVTSSSDFTDGEAVVLSSFDGTLAELNSNTKYVDVINSTTIDLYHDTALSDPIRYFNSVTGQAVTEIDLLPGSGASADKVQVIFAGLGGIYSGATVDFVDSSGANIYQDRLHALAPLIMTHVSGTTETYEISDLATSTPLTIPNFFNNDYTTFGTDGQTIKKSSTSAGKYNFQSSSDSKTMFRIQKAEYIAGVKTWVDGLNDFPWTLTSGIQTTDANGDTTHVTVDRGYLKSKYLCAYDLTDRKQVGFGFYVNPVMGEDVNTYVQINKQPKQDPDPTHLGYRSYAWVNYNGLSDQDGGQYLQNDGNSSSNYTRWYIDEGTVPFTNTQNVNYNTFGTMADGKKYKISLFGPNNGIYTPTNQMAGYPTTPSAWTGDTTYQGATMGSYLKTQVLWDPLNTSKMLPGYDYQNQTNYSPAIQLNFAAIEHPSGEAGAPALYKKLDDILDGTSSDKGIYTDLVLSKTATDTAKLAFGSILCPVRKFATHTSWNGSSYDYSYGIQCVMLDARISEVTFGEKTPTATDLPYETYNTSWGGPISTVNLANTEWNALGSTNWPNGNNDRVQSDYQTETYVTGGSSGPYQGGNISLFSAGECPYFTDLSLSSPHNWDGRSIGSMTEYYELKVNSSETTLWDTCRTGTIVYPYTAGTPTEANKRYLKLKTATSTTKIFTLHEAVNSYSGGTGSLPNGTYVVQWQYAKPLTNTQMSWLSTEGETIFPIANDTGAGFSKENSKYIHEVTSNPTELYETPEVRYLDAGEPAGTTVNIGNVTITDSTTGNIALGGTYNHKADNPHVYFPGNQTYQQRTGASTYVNGAILSDDYYDINTSTTADFTSGTKPAVTISQSTQGYISGVSLGSVGRITPGQKMLTIGTTPDSYTPPALTPAEAEDVFDTDDEWATDGFDAAKQWPDHVTPMSAVINYNSPTLVNNSQSGIKYTRSVGHTKWRLEVEYPPMKAEDFQKFHAIAQAAHGQSTPFYFNLNNKNGTSILWKDFYDQTNSTTSPRVKNAITSGDTTLLVEGFNSNESTVFVQGEVFIDGENENGNLHTSLSGTDANVFGEAKIRTPWPFRTATAAGEKIYKNPTHAIVTLGNDNFEYQVDVNNYYFVSVTFDLDSWK